MAHARRVRDGRAARPRLVRERAPYHGADERGELVAGAGAEGGQQLLERAAARARSEQRERRVDGQRREGRVSDAAGGGEVLREAEREWRQGGMLVYILFGTMRSLQPIVGTGPPTHSVPATHPRPSGRDIRARTHSSGS